MRWIVLAILPCILSGSKVIPAEAGEKSAREIFDQRILPIFRSPNPSSCVQCHLAGVDLKNYILPSAEQTFVSLRDQGLIDLNRPEKSRILALIQMGAEEKAGANLIHQKRREAERAAFADWIKRSAQDKRLRALPKLDVSKQAKPKRPVEVIRHARKDHVLESFTTNVWAMRFRCMGCHTEGTAQGKKLVEEHGPRVAWFAAAGPEATLDYLRKSKLLNIDRPEKSLLLRKPLNEVKHGGGQKIVVGDQGYKALRAFVEDYARIMKDRYPDADALPKTKAEPARFGSDIWLKVTNTPPDWGDKLLQVNLYAWDAGRKTWEAKPIATSDRVVWGKGKLWQHNLTLMADRGSTRAKSWAAGKPSLPRSAYRLVIHVDRAGKLGKDWKATLGKGDLAGHVEIRSAWPEGYGQMTAVDGATVK